MNTLERLRAGIGERLGPDVEDEMWLKKTTCWFGTGEAMSVGREQGGLRS